MTGENGGVKHPVALFDGFAKDIGGHAFAQNFNDAGAFVAHYPARRRDGHMFLGLVTTRGMQVRAADARLSHA